MEFEKKVVLITGGSSGIGKEAAVAYAKEGAQVVISDINEKGGKETVDEVSSTGGKISFIKTNVANYEEVRALMSQIVADYGRLDIAINNAGIGGPLSKTPDTTPENYEQVMAINAGGVFYCMKEQIPIMLKQGGGSIINTASIAGLRGLPNGIAYVASKHAVVGMTKTAAMEYARNNIRINALCPVFTVTPLFNPDVMDSVSAGLSDKLKSGIPMKRFAEVKEQVDAMMWLSSDKASFVTGLALPIDGGITA